MSRFARKVVVNYDGDNAGVQAAKKAIAILLAEDLEVKILVLPDGSDPDEFIRKSGVSEYQQQRGLAQPHIQFVIDQAVRDRKLSNPADKEAALQDVLPYIRAVHSRFQKREYFEIAMDSLRIADAALKRELWHSIRQGASEGARGQITIKPAQVKPTVAEERLLGVVFANEELRAGVLQMLQPEDYEDLATAPVLKALLELDSEQQEISFDSLSEKLEGDAMVSQLLPMLMMSESLHASNEHYTPEECVFTFRLMKLQNRIDQLRDESLIAEREGDTKRILKVSAEQTDLAKRKSALLTKAEAMQIGH
jgi:DNA primase